MVMTYDYKKLRTEIFTEQGVNLLLHIKSKANRSIRESGATTIGNLISNISICDDVHHAIACVEYLIERGDLKEITDPDIRCQDRVVVGG